MPDNQWSGGGRDERIDFLERTVKWMQDHLSSMEKEVERLEADARRWRWVRREHGPECLEVRPHYSDRYRYGIVVFLNLEDADKAVDQAIAASHGREVSGGA